MEVMSNLVDRTRLGLGEIPGGIKCVYITIRYISLCKAGVRVWEGTFFEEETDFVSAT